MLHRFNNDILDSSNERKQFLWHATAGLDGDFEVGDRDFFWSVSATHGESNGQTRRDGIIDGRFLSAIDVRQLTAADFVSVDDNGTPLDPTDDITTTITEADILGFSGTSSAGVGDIVCESAYQAAFGNVSGLSGNGVTDGDLPFVQGCVPLNLFGKGVRSEAAKAWVTGNQMTQTDIEQTVFNFNFGGDLFELPGGSLGFNVGYEAREERAAFVPGTGTSVPISRSSPFEATGGQYETDEFYGEVVVPLFSPDMNIPALELLELSGAIREIDNTLAGSATVWTTGMRWAPISRSSPFEATGGQYETDEFYGEVVVPLFSPDMNIPALELLELSGAIREIDNTLAGSATVWTTGMRWAPIRDVSFRANYTESIRAPSLVELFAPRSQVFDFADDPCDNRFVTDGPVPRE